MPFVQIKFPVKLANDNLVLPNGWTKTKHLPHVTFVEIFVAPEILDSALEWLRENPIQLEMEFTKWFVLYCRKQHFAVLAPDSNEPLHPYAPLAAREILLIRSAYLKRLLDHFQCSCQEVEVDGLPLWRYARQDGVVLFSLNRYNNSNVWVPHVTVAVKFSKLEERYTIDWPVAFATISGPMELQVIDKPNL